MIRSLCVEWKSCSAAIAVKMRALVLFSAVFVSAVLVSGCNVGDETDALLTMEDEKRDWVFMQINVPEEGDKIDTYYYFAQISSRQYRAISQNTLTSGFILLKNTRYWGDGDVIHAYEDIEDTGELIFRIEDIHYIRRMKVEPKVGYGSEQWDELNEAAEAEESVLEEEKAEPVVTRSAEIQG